MHKAALARPKSKLMGLDFLLGMGKEPLKFLEEGTRQYGPLVHVKLLHLNVFVINHPEYAHEALMKHWLHLHKWRGLRDEFGAQLMGEGLVRSSGTIWQTQRKLIQPAFHSRRVAAHGEIMVRYTDDLIKTWQPGEIRDISADMMRLTLNILAKSLFDLDISPSTESILEALEILQEYLPKQAGSFVPLPEWIPTLPNRRVGAAIKILDEVISTIIDQHQSSDAEHGDLLSMLMAAMDEEHRLNRKQLRDEIMNFMVAGFETAANTLAWLWYLLALHPEVEAKLVSEIDQALCGQLPTTESLARLPYTNLIAQETLRLYPPGWLLGRKAVQDIRLLDMDIPKDSMVLFSPYLIHRLPEYWDNPNQFIPERFGTESSIPHGAYIPFTEGPRVCVGKPFAMMEIRLILATIAQRFHLSLMPDQQVELMAGATLHPKENLRMRVTTRSQHCENNTAKTGMGRL